MEFLSADIIERAIDICHMSFICGKRNNLEKRVPSNLRYFSQDYTLPLKVQLQQSIEYKYLLYMLGIFFPGQTPTMPASFLKQILTTTPSSTDPPS